MADNILESNVILKSKIHGPEGQGPKNLKKFFDDLKKQLDGITGQEYKIRFVIDDAGLKQAQLGVIAKQQGQQVGQQLAQGIQQGAQAQLNRKDLKVKTTTRQTEEGESVTTRRTQQAVRGNRLITTTQTSGDSGTVETEERVNLARQVANLRSLQEAKGRLAQTAVYGPGNETPQERRDRLLRQSEVAYGPGNETPKQRQDRLLRQSSPAYSPGNETPQQRQQRLLRQSSPEYGPGNETPQQRKERLLRQSSPEYGPGNESQQERKARLDAAAARALEAGRARAHAKITDLSERGYKEQSTMTTFDPKTGKEQTVSTFYKTVQKGLGQWEVMEARVNRATGKSTESLLSQAAAARKLGDSFGRAIEKVSLWLGATSVVFAFARGAQEATRQVMELEEATTLLARVGKNFGSNFQERFIGAKKVEREVVNFATVSGADPAESMKAAQVFGRAGQSVKETIDSVKASMLAARVAEISVLEAAELLSAAYLQFNLNAREILPTLDQLNALSNNYRVTTDDLLQAISRSGSVIGQQNGRLTELAAVVAVTAQSTARSGSEIGNAIKTIASNLERADTKALLFEKLGVTTSHADGTSKSYTRTLLEMSIALNRVSESERNQITIGVAGVRQRNILLDQLKNVVESIKAENATLLQGQGVQGGGSALEELADTSRTLTAYLGRLRGEAVKLASEGGGPLMEMAKDVVAILTAMLRTLSSGNGLPARMAATAVGIYLVVASLKLLSTHVKSATVDALVAAVAHYRLGMACLQSGASAGQASVAFAMMNREVVAAGAAAMASIGKMAAVYLIFEAIAKTLRSYQEGQEFLERSTKNSIDAATQQVDAESNREKALRNSATAVSILADEIDRLKKAGGNQESIQTYEQQARSLGADFGIEGGSVRDIENRLYQSQMESQENVVNARRQRLESLKGKRDALQFNMETTYQPYGRDIGLSMTKALTGNLESKLGQHVAGQAAMGGYGSNIRNSMAKEFFETYHKAQGGDKDAAKELILQQKDFSTQGLVLQSEYGVLLELASKYSESKIAFQDNEKAIKEEEKALKGLEEQLLTVMQHQREYRELNITAQKAIEGMARKEINSQGTSFLKQFFGEDSDYRQVFERMTELQTWTKNFHDNLDKLKVAPGAPEWQVLDKKYNELRGVTNSFQRIVTESRSRTTSKDLDSGLSMRGTMMMSQYDVKAAMDHQSSYSASLKRTAAEAGVAQENIDALNQAAKTADPVERREIAKKLQEQLNTLGDLEVRKAEELWKVEAGIAIERKKSADEAMRALGAMSDTDKMRALANAKFFKENPDKKFSSDELFFMRGEDAAFLEKNFNGKIDRRLDPKTNPLSTFLAEGGYGSNGDVDRAQRDVDRFRDGRRDEGIFNDARDRYNTYRAQGEGVTGGAPITPGYHLPSGAAGLTGQATLPPMNINASLDFGPLIMEFTSILKQEGQTIVDDAAKQFDAHFRAYKNYKGLPASAEPGG